MVSSSVRAVSTEACCRAASSPNCSRRLRASSAAWSSCSIRVRFLPTSASSLRSSGRRPSIRSSLATRSRRDGISVCACSSACASSRARSSWTRAASSLAFLACSASFLASSASRRARSASSIRGTSAVARPAASSSLRASSIFGALPWSSASRASRFLRSTVFACRSRSLISRASATSLSLRRTSS